MEYPASDYKTGSAVIPSVSYQPHWQSARHPPTMISSVRNLCIFSLLVGAGTTFGLALDKRANPAVVLDLDGTVVIKGGWREATAGGERWPINTYTEYTKGQHWLIDGLGQNPPVTLQYLEWESMGSQLKSHGAVSPHWH